MIGTSSAPELNSSITQRQLLEGVDAEAGSAANVGRSCGSDHECARVQRTQDKGAQRSAARSRHRPDLFLGYSHENEYSQDHSQPTSRHQATCSRIEFQHIDRQWGAAESQLLSAASIPNLSDARRPGLAGRPASQTKMAPSTGRVPAPQLLRSTYYRPRYWLRVWASPRFEEALLARPRRLSPTAARGPPTRV